MSRQTSLALLLLVLAAAAPAAGGQEITHASSCRPQGGDAYAAGESILFTYRPDGPEVPPVIPKLPVEAYPPCIPVVLAAHDLAGRPPFQLDWTGPDGTTWSGNPVEVDTTNLPTGVNGITLTVSNGAGEAVKALNLWVARLDDRIAAPVPDQAPSPDLQVTFAAHAEGAHEWRWDFGDGTVTPWEAPCDFFHSIAAHTFPAAGTYSVVAYARNCRDGTVASTPLEISVGGG